MAYTSVDISPAFCWYVRMWMIDLYEWAIAHPTAAGAISVVTLFVVIAIPISSWRWRHPDKAADLDEWCAENWWMLGVGG